MKHLPVKLYQRKSGKIKGNYFPAAKGCSRPS
jgi:hypothetical protein